MQAGSPPRGVKRAGSTADTPPSKRHQPSVPAQPGIDTTPTQSSLDHLLRTMRADCEAAPEDTLPIKTDALRRGLMLAQTVDDFQRLREHVDQALLDYFPPLGPALTQAQADAALPPPAHPALALVPQSWALTQELTERLIGHLAPAEHTTPLARSLRAFARALMRLALTQRWFHHQLKPLLASAHWSCQLAVELESGQLEHLNHRLLGSPPCISDQLSLSTTAYDRRQALWLAIATRAALGSAHSPHWLKKLFLAAECQAQGGSTDEALNHLRLDVLPNHLMACDPELNAWVAMASRESAWSFDPTHPPLAWMVEHFPSFAADTQLLLWLTLELNFDDTDEDIQAVEDLVAQLLARLPTSDRSALAEQVARWQPLFAHDTAVDGALLDEAIELLNRLPLVGGDVCLQLLDRGCLLPDWRQSIGDAALVGLLIRLLGSLIAPGLQVDEMVLDHVLERFPRALVLAAFNALPGEWRIHLLSRQYGAAYTPYMLALAQADDIALDERWAALNDMIERAEDADEDEHPCLDELRRLRDRLSAQRDAQGPTAPSGALPLPPPG